MKSLLDVRLPGLIWFSFLFVWFFCCTFWEGFLFYLPTIYLLLNFSFLQFFLIPRNQVLSCHQFSSVAQSCPTLCNPMNCSTPGLAVHHQLPELTQTQVHGVGDAIQPSHPLSSPSPPAPNPSQHQNLFQWVNSWGGQSTGVSALAYLCINEWHQYFLVPAFSVSSSFCPIFDCLYHHTRL